MLQQTGKFNDFSSKLIERIEKRIESFGTTVRYRFDIERPNPDPTFYNGKTVFPSIYTLDPAYWVIQDKEEDRAGKPKTKNVAIVLETDDKGNPTKYGRIRISAVAKGILELNLEKPEDVETCIALELHPKLKDGDFADKTLVPVVSRVDEQAAATEERQERSLRLKAMNIATQMSEAALIQFAEGMLWDATQKPSVLANLVETLAEEDPKFFTDLVDSKELEYRATVKRAMNMGKIIFDPADYNFKYGGNNQPIVTLSPVGDKSEVEKMAEWLFGQEAVYKKIKSLTENKEKAAAV